MDATSFEGILGKALEHTGFEIVAEHCGWSFYDRKLEAGFQLLANTHSLDELVRIVLQHCVFVRGWRGKGPPVKPK